MSLKGSTEALEVLESRYNDGKGGNRRVLACSMVNTMAAKP